MQTTDEPRATGHGNMRTPKVAMLSSREHSKPSLTRIFTQTLPQRYMGCHGFMRNSFFVKRLMWATSFLVLVDGGGLAYMFYSQYSADRRSTFYLEMDTTNMEANDQTCLKWTWFARIVYFTLPFVLFLGLSSSGFRVFDLFTRTHVHVDASGQQNRATMATTQRISTKVQRTWYLQLCEVICVLLMVFHVGMVFFVIVTFVQSGFKAKLCRHYVPLLNAFVAFFSWIGMGFQFTYFTRLRDHLKMQLGAFKEGELTGTTKKSFDADRPNQPRDKLIAEIKKRLFHAAELNNLDDMRVALDMAITHLGGDFASIHYGSATLGFLFNFSKKNPMHAAATNGNVVMLQMLYDAGFSVNTLDKINRVRLSTGDIFWYFSQAFIHRPVISTEESAAHLFKTTLVTPLHCAVAASRVDAVRWLLDHGADVNIRARATMHDERLPPIFICDHPTIMEMLLAANADHLYVPNPGGSQTLTVLELSYMRGNFAVASVLEEWGADVALTPLHAAAGSNDVLSVHRMLRYCDPNCLGEYGYVGFNRRTPLHWAAIGGCSDTMLPLLVRGADVEFADAMGRTALHWAARVNRLECVLVLLEHQANASARDYEGMTPAFCAALSENVEPRLLEALVQYGANINATLINGDTPLHVAMKRGNRAAALALLSVGADINAVNDEGSRAIDCTTSTELQFAVKRAAGSRDVMISYTHSHAEFAKKLRASFEQNHVTTWLDLMDPNGIGGGSVWREEIARGIANASCVVAILTEDYPKSEWCLKELAYAKQVGTPVLAISTENVQISEELQVYLYTRQIVPFESAITFIESTNPRNITYLYNEDRYSMQFRSLLDGVRDEMEKKRALAMPKMAAAQWHGTLLNAPVVDDSAPFVFLASGDCHEQFVRQVYNDLSTVCRVYLDHASTHVDPSTRISAAKEAILKCAAFIVVLSEKNQNEIVLDQLAFAEDKGKPMFPILLSDPASYLGLGLQYTLSRNEVYHFTQNIGFHRSMTHLSKAVEKLILPTVMSTLSRRQGYLATMKSTTLSSHEERWSLASDGSGTSTTPRMPRL